MAVVINVGATLLSPICSAVDFKLLIMVKSILWKNNQGSWKFFIWPFQDADSDGIGRWINFPSNERFDCRMGTKAREVYHVITSLWRSFECIKFKSPLTLVMEILYRNIIGNCLVHTKFWLNCWLVWLGSCLLHTRRVSFHLVLPLGIFGFRWGQISSFYLRRRKGLHH